VGFLPSTQSLNLIIHLPVRNQYELTRLIDRLSDPTSPDYRHWLSVAEFSERFGRTEAEYIRVADFAEANGFTVTYKSPNRLMLVVRGSVAQIEDAFHVKMRTYRHPAEGRIFYSPDREPSFALDVPVSHISGLNNYSYPHPGAGPRPAELGGSNYGGGPGATGSGPGGTFLGSDMRPAYNMGSNTGTGQTVGLAEFAGYATSDVSLYFSNIHQTNNVPIDNIVVDGGSATAWSNANDEGEVCLDIEQAVSVAPGLTQLRVYIGPEDFGSGVDGFIFNQMATDNVAKQLSNSWWWSPDDPATDDPYFDEMAAQGQTIFSISGDNGAYTGDNRQDEGYPAEDVHLTVVGGTALTTASAGGAWQSEVVWNDFGSGSGGGPADDGAANFAIQSWQTPVINSSNGGSTTLRNSPDVALQADFVNYICYDSGTCAGDWGGTSFATPRWAAWLALVNQQLVANGQPAGLGFINPALYLIGQGANYTSDFHDITSGNNDTSGQAEFYNAVTGYDLTTGWGSMNGQNLMADLIGPAAQNFTLSAPSTPASVPAGESTTSTFSVTTSDNLPFASAVTFACNGLPDATITCAFTTIAAGATSPQTVTLTIATAGPNPNAAKSQGQRRADNRAPWLPLALPLAGVVMAGLAGWKMSKHSAIAGLCVSLVLLGLLIACGGGTTTVLPVIVSVSPSGATLFASGPTGGNWPLQTKTFTASVMNSTQGVTWTASTGAIVINPTNPLMAMYTSPMAAEGLPPSATITATSQADATAKATATVTITPTSVPGMYPNITVTATEGAIHNNTSDFTLTVE